MGWTSFHKPYGLSIDEIFEREFKGLQFVGKGALVNLSEYYRAVYIPAHKDANGNNVEGFYICFVALVRMGKGEFAYKDMTEDMLPYYFNCPNINGNRYGKRKTMKLQSYHYGFTVRIPKWKGMEFEVVGDNNA